ncbi:hypothetical protein EMIT0158MI4_40251 [Burkholderia ambifaria]
MTMGGLWKATERIVQHGCCIGRGVENMVRRFVTGMTVALHAGKRRTARRCWRGAAQRRCGGPLDAFIGQLMETPYSQCHFEA